jgi:hypothetical protein
MLKLLPLLAALLILQSHGVAGQDKYAPLPEKVVNAKTFSILTTPLAADLAMIFTRNLESGTAGKW